MIRSVRAESAVSFKFGDAEARPRTRQSLKREILWNLQGEMASVNTPVPTFKDVFAKLRLVLRAVMTWDSVVASKYLESELL